ncbi:MAG: thioesterase family protein [Betaproteobacteria bacterium]|nr:thioesterase family protein [Betaproteobacteria bacterium]
MNSEKTLEPGLRGSAEIVVGEQHTAPHVGSGRVRVLATPVMVNLMEAAALQAVEGLLPAGHQTVGTHLDLRHYAATPVGMRVRAHAELTKVEKRTLTFSIYAEDETERIGDGVHERIIINLERFDRRMQEKAGLSGKGSR